MRFDTWNVRSLYRTVSFMAAARELARYKLGLVGVQVVRWDREGTIRAGLYIFFYGNGDENDKLGTGVFVHDRILSAFKRVELVSERISYIQDAAKIVKHFKILVTCFSARVTWNAGI